MADLTETATWEAGVFQLETTTPALGGPGGPANSQAQALANRSAYLRAQVEGHRLRLDKATREAVMRDDQGLVHHMVWVPRFRVLPNTLVNNTWPPVALELGGFYVDKYPCSHPTATPTARGIADDPSVAVDSATDIAQSRPGVVGWTNITRVYAAIACANRKFAGKSCHLITPWEWGAILLLMQSNPGLRGSNYQGRDVRDPDLWEYRGIADPTNTDRCLVGTGPGSWAHNADPSGVVDLIGNIPEMVDMEVHATRYVHYLSATLVDAGGILAADTAMVIGQPARIEQWPATDGLCVIRAEGLNTQEYIRYATLVDNEDGTWTLTGCSRAQRATSASDHGEGAEVELRSDYCLMPGGASGYVNNSGINNDTDVTSVFEMRELVLGPGTEGFEVGAVLDVDGERMLVTGDSEAAGIHTLTVTRGYDGTAKAAHAAGLPLAVLGSALGAGVGYWDFAGWAQSLRTETHLLDSVLPGDSAADYVSGESLDDALMISVATDTVLMRGGYSVSPLTPDGYRGFHVSIVPDDGARDLGFRAAYRVE